MRVPEHWLRAFVDPKLSADEIGERLTMIGLEVEENLPVAPPFDHVVVAHVLEVTRHPNADRLNVCTVDVGQGAPRQIVCGAPNVAPGQRVPCALPGARLPNDVTIKASAVRGVESGGMLCSAAELGITEDASGLWILPPDTPVGAPLRQALKLDERCLTLKLTPNRGDCLSVFGVARELSAATGAPLCAPTFEPVPPTCDDTLPVRIHAPDLCGRFSGRVIRGLDARAETPFWMKQRLERAGQRPISALVDISNYVMLELGRPSHVFDLAKVKGGLDVRWGKAGETAELLNGQTVTVDETIGVISDASGIEAIAGIMGGNPTAVSLDTTDVFVEAAFWWPESIRGRTRRFNFSTDAAHRFERGVDGTTTVAHIDYITRLILDVCGTPRTKVGPVTDEIRALPVRTPVTLRAARCRKVLGIPVGDAEIAGVLQRLGLAFTQDAAAGTFTVTPPAWRFDMEIEEDLIEEVARLHGFERIPAVPPVVPAAMRSPLETTRSAHDVRLALAGAGYVEVVTYSFVEEAWERDFAGNDTPIRVLNPIASHLAVMRSTLLGGLVGALTFNLNRRADRARLFEIGRRFRRDPSVADGPLAVAGVDQPLMVAGLAYGPADAEQWGTPRRPVDFFDVKGDVEALAAGRALAFEAAAHPALHPGRSARVTVDGRPAGWVGELHPRLVQQYELPQPAIVFELALAPLLAQRIPRAMPVPRHQAVMRDIAVWVDAAVPVQRVIEVVWKARATDARLSALQDFRLFDLYRPLVEGSSSSTGSTSKPLFSKEKSLAFRCLLQDTQRALGDAEADAAMAAITEALAAGVAARLRG